ncbi:hypothetical protein S958_003082 [Salmonella enterica subsp. enterica]|nr:hypothetical protein [Salmonella enterica subsp. enterica]
MSTAEKFTTDIPEWFNLDSYVPFRNMSYRQLAKQLHYRLHTLMIMNLGQLHFFDLMYKQGVVIPVHEGSKKYGDWVRDIQSQGRRLSGSLAIHPIDRTELSWMAVQKEASDLEITLPKSVDIMLGDLVERKDSSKIIMSSDEMAFLMQNDVEKLHRIEHESIDLLLPKSNSVHVKIDLSMPDRFIMEGLKGLLSEWRSQMNIPTPNPKLKSSLVILKSNFITYRAFQIIDLKLWAKSNNFKYRESFLHSIVFPDGDKSLNLDDFRKKALPFAEDVLDPRLPAAMLDMCRMEEKKRENSSEE